MADNIATGGYDFTYTTNSTIANNVIWTFPDNLTYDSTEEVPESNESLEDKIKDAISKKVLVYNSESEDGTVYLQVKGPEGKTYNVMVVIEQD